MRILSNLVLALATITPALAIDQKKSAIMYFKDTNIPDSVVDKAKETIIKAGCKITHEYSTTIRGFAFVAPEKALEKVRIWGAKNSMNVEEDEMVLIQ